MALTLPLLGCFSNYRYAELGAEDVVLAVGDQFTSGGNVSESFRYTSVLGKSTSAKILNLGQSGASVMSTVPILKSGLSNYTNVRLIIVNVGYNDMLRGVDSRFVTAAFMELFREAQRANVPLLLVGIPTLPYVKGRDKPSALFEELGSDPHVIYERDVFSMVLKDAANMESGNQFNADGYRVFAEGMEARLRKEGFIRN